MGISLAANTMASNHADACSTGNKQAGLVWGGDYRARAKAGLSKSLLFDAISGNLCCTSATKCDSSSGVSCCVGGRSASGYAKLG